MPTADCQDSTQPTIDYNNKMFLAPMVRVGTLPFRLTVLDYGADLVWSEELVDKRVIGSVRKYNPITKTIEYWKENKLTFSTHENERGKVIFQLGTADPDLALKAALTVKQDVAGFDLNCGCPKRFSVHAGMGAALLTNPELLKKILINLVQNVGLPVTCKVRLLEDMEKTKELLKMIESTGVKAITVHCRYRDQRSSTPARWDEFKEAISVVKSIPVAVNGDVFCYKDIESIKEKTNANSVMIARGAQYNPSAFRKEGLVSTREAAEAYIKWCVRVNNVYQNTKYVLLTMSNDPKYSKTDLYRKIQQAKSNQAICEIFGMESFYNEIQELHKARQEEEAKKEEANAGDKRKLEENEESKEEKKDEEPPTKTLKVDGDEQPKAQS
ncbi:trna-dihydrouridine synthase [Lichtheimia corymbifera JMRC:FSU:9682]|uniref:tRNA-dihydrouridine synthase n=1 Tax=Lichtheimia corymbifera JMRC:FSU:9682 TaxID=1263082 RepID=A0A068RS53_9FUNG|nr:trna-dihydrouridine synthase [Lichtheimia corymbifera JMRC:FSU:9682]